VLCNPAFLQNEKELLKRKNSVCDSFIREETRFRNVPNLDNISLMLKDVETDSLRVIARQNNNR
jgi:hypothetical protein